MRLLINILIFILTVNAPFEFYGQFNVAGYVKESDSEEKLIGVNIVENAGTNGTFTDNNGYFAIKVNSRSDLHFSFVGYKSKTIKINSKKDSLLIVYLERGKELEEVIIKSVKTNKINTVTLNAKQLENLPSLSGKPDIMKSLQMLPGIQGQKEGAANIIVRGGEPGQNLYLLDNVPLVYVNHLGGFMSVFNPDIINNIEVYKSGFPPKYGGKLSSIINITQKEGNKTTRKGSLNIGLTDLGFTVEGPFANKKLTYIVIGRKTLTEPLMYLVSNYAEGDYTVFYGFHDINAKLTWKPDFKNQLFFNFYQGDDYLNYRSGNKNSKSKEGNRIANIWGNWLISFRWNKIIKPGFFLANSLSYTRYRFKRKQSFQTVDSDSEYHQTTAHLSSIDNILLKTDFKYSFSNSILNWGVETAIKHYIPNKTKSTNPNYKEYQASDIKIFEPSIYSNYKKTFYEKIQINTGLRLNNYIGKNKKYYSINPRFNLRYDIKSNHIINFNYMKATQNEHLILTSGSIMSNEVWIPASENVLPATSSQYSLSYQNNFHNELFTSEFNLYYKEMDNLATYKEGYRNLFGDVDWMSKIAVNGQGESTGLEYMIKKNTGKIRGELSYSLSKSTRKYNEINNGKSYLYNFDRTHTLSLFLNWSFSEKLSFNMAWIYQTGLPYTPSIGRHLAPSVNQDAPNEDNFYYDVYIIGDKNSARMKDYHRLDVGFKYTVQTKRKRKAVWSFSIYNLYNKKNPYYYYFNSDASDEIYKPELNGGNKPMALYQISFFPILPSVSYKLYFDKKTEKKSKSSRKTIRDWLFYSF